MEYLTLLSNGWIQIIATVVIAYLLGSISFSIIITRLSDNNADIRTMGSGNAGFTNVLRSVGKKAAIFTIIFDFLKGVISVLIGWFLFSTIKMGDYNALLQNEVISCGKYIGGVSCMFGHIFPIYFGFRGGKGVVTAAALLAVADWRIFFLSIATFALVFIITKTISRASILSALLLPVYAFVVTYFFDYLPSQNLSKRHTFSYVIIATSCMLLVAVTVIVKHKDNIKRILAGTEKKITLKRLP